MNWNIERKTNLLQGLFVAALIAANLLGSKITEIGFVDFSVGLFAYPITFLITDIVEEVHDKSRVKEFVMIGFFSLVFVLGLTSLSVSLPFAERSLVQQEEYTQVFEISLRIFLASITAFLISQLHDVWAFHFWKEKTEGKYLWLRNNLSTVSSQFLDTTIFMFIAFYGISPKFDLIYIFTLIIPYWTLKMVVAFFDTPFVYLGVSWLRDD